MRKGEIRRLMMAIAPPASPTRIKPNHSVITPVRPIEISKAVPDILKVASIIWLRTSGLPRKKTWYRAETAAKRKKLIQILFSKTLPYLSGRLIRCPCPGEVVVTGNRFFGSQQINRRFVHPHQFLSCCIRMIQ